MKLFDTASLSWYLLRNLHSDAYDDTVAVLNGYTNAVEDRLMQTVPVMETNLEGAQKRIAKVIEWFEDENADPKGLLTHAADLEYIAVFLDRLNDHIEAAKARHDLQTPTP